MDVFSKRRMAMVEEYVRPYVSDERVLRACAMIPRHLFVDDEFVDRAYDDAPLPIGSGQTISQPSLVAEMLAYLGLRGDEVVLEVGTGSGYQAALLSLLAKKVYSVERIARLAAAARARLKRLKISNVEIVTANGSLGWPEAAPFAAIIVAAGSARVPPPLIQQLKDGGRIVIPIEADQDSQRLVVGQKVRGTMQYQRHDYVQFVPLVGVYGTVKM